MQSTAYVGFFLALLAAGQAAAQTFMEKAERDELSFVRRDDPDMEAAKRAARATLQDFLTLARTPRPSTSGFAVKVAVRDRSNVEYFWVIPFKQEGARFSGRIDNTPRLVKSVKLGQSFVFAEPDIVDWLYVDQGRMRGNYTACAILKREPPDQAEAAKKRFGLECER